MVYFIDEDIGQAEAWAAILGVKGYDTQVIGDAESALRHFAKCDDVELVIIDVMLAGSADGTGTHFRRDETDDFQMTGVILLDELVKLRGDIFPISAVLLSQNVKREIVQRIEGSALHHCIPFWRKAEFNDITEFYVKAVAQMEVVREYFRNVGSE